MNKRSVLHVFIVIFIVFGILEAGAQEKEDLLFEELPVVITASRQEEAPADSPVRVEVITARQLETYGYETLADALRSLPGIDIVGSTQYPRINPRGLMEYGACKQVLVMVDGVVQHKVYEGSAETWHNFPLTYVDRIEVIKGPGSSMWGANAFSGVINVITKNGKQIAGGKAKAELGSNNTRKIELLLGKELGRDFEGLLAARLFNSDGVLGNPYNKRDYLDDLDVYAKIAYKTVSLSLSYSKAERGYNGSSVLPLGKSYEQSDQFYGNFRYHNHFNNKLSLETQAYYRFTGYDFWLEGGPVLQHIVQKENLFNAGGNVQYLFSPYHSLLLGFESRFEWMDSRLGGKESYKGNNTAVYWQYQWKPVIEAIFTLGGRLDLHSTYGTVMSPRLALVYVAAEKTLMRLSYGRAFRAPAMGELYVDFWIGPNRHKGNPDLKPEKLNTVELALEQTIGESGKGVITFFYTHGEELIDFDRFLVDPPGPMIYFEMVAANKVRTCAYGAEIAFDFKVNRYIGAFINYSYQHAEDIGTKEELLWAPRHKANLGLRFNFAERFPLKGGVVCHYVGKRIEEYKNDGAAFYLPAYFYCNARLTCPLTRSIEAALTVYNLFNANIEEIRYHPRSGRRIMGSVGVSF